MPKPSTPATPTLNSAMALFTNAPLAPAPPAPKAVRKKDREEVEFSEDIDNLAALKIVAKALTGVAEVIEDEQKTEAYRLMAERMIAHRMKPEAFIAVGPRSTAYVTLSKKGSNSALDPDTLAKLAEIDVPVDHVVKIPGRLVINPDVLADQELLGELATTLAANPRFANVIMQQEEQAIDTVGEDTIPALARVVPNDVDRAAALLRRVSTISIGKFKIDDDKDPTRLIEKSLEIISGARLLTGMTVAPNGEVA